MRRLHLLALLWPAVAQAEPETTAPPTTHEPTAADVAGAPLPGRESGRLDPPDQDSLVRDVAQGVLVVPRVAIEVAAVPLRGGLWAYDRYQLSDRFHQIFFDDSRTYGLYPTLVFDSNYGVTGGARFVHRDLFGEREHFALRGGAGGEFRMRAHGALRSGRRLGNHIEVELGGELERRPKDPFFGIGNTAEGTVAHHRQQLLRTTARLDVRVVQSLYVRGAAAVTDLDYGRAEDVMPIDTVYSPATLVGWTGVRNVHGDLELRWDTRRHVSPLDRHPIFERGWLLAAYGGRVHQLEAGADYWRYGAHLQHFWRLARGPSAIATRLQVDAVTGQLGDVAFTQLPELGGRATLRGYPAGRFRDRIATVGSAEYTWAIGHFVTASLFTDIGRVLPSWNEPPNNIRVGYGLSLQLNDDGGSYLADLTLATSIDGGFFVNLSFDPVFTIHPRVEQR